MVLRMEKSGIVGTALGLDMSERVDGLSPGFNLGGISTELLSTKGRYDLQTLKYDLQMLSYDLQMLIRFDWPLPRLIPEVVVAGEILEHDSRCQASLG